MDRGRRTPGRFDGFQRGATRRKAVDALDGLSGMELVNAETDIRARINKPQRNKIISSTALEKSERNGFTATHHYAVASRMGKVWKHASLVKSRADNEGDINIASIKRFESPIMLDGKPAIAYVTAKESVEYGHRIYSLELTEIKTARGLGNTPSGNEGERATPHGLPLAENGDNHLPTVSPRP